MIILLKTFYIGNNEVDLLKKNKLIFYKNQRANAIFYDIKQQYMTVLYLLMSEHKKSHDLAFQPTTYDMFSGDGSGGGGGSGYGSGGSAGAYFGDSNTNYTMKTINYNTGSSDSSSSSSSEQSKKEKHWIKLMKFSDFSCKNFYYIKHKPKINFTIDENSTSSEFYFFVKKYSLNTITLANTKMISFTPPLNLNLKKFKQVKVKKDNTFLKIIPKELTLKNGKFEYSHEINPKELTLKNFNPDIKDDIFKLKNFSNKFFNNFNNFNKVKHFIYMTYLKFKNILNIANLQCPTSNENDFCYRKAGDFYNYTNDNFYYDNDNMIFKICGYKNRSELRFIQNWNFNDTAKQEFTITAKVEPYTDEFTFMQIHGITDNLNKPILRMATFKNEIKAFIWNGSSYESYVLQARDDNYMTYKIIAGNKTLQIYKLNPNNSNNSTFDLVVNTAINYPSDCYFKCGAYLQRDGCAITYIKDIQIKYNTK